MAWKSNRVMWDCNSPYAYRDDNLRALGFKSYRAYLKSDLWKSIRARVTDRDKGKCSRCRKPAKAPQVHHRAYDPATLRGDNIDSLSLACGRCHRKAERPDDRNRSRHDRLQEASAMLAREHARRRSWRDRNADYAPMWSQHVKDQRLD